MNTKHICIELGSGVFDKPQALGDYLVQIKKERTLVVCPNSSDIRFVENILRRRSLPARRITEFLEDNDVSEITAWLEKQQNIIVVCGVKAGLKISNIWNASVILYAPLADTESYLQISNPDNFSFENTDNNDRLFVTLVSPQELPQYLNIKKQINTVETIQIKEEDSIASQKEVLDHVLAGLPSRGSILATELAREYAKELGVPDIDTASPAFTNLKKLLSFLMENSLGTAPKSSIEEELQLVEKDQSEEKETDNRKSWNGSPKGKKDNRRNDKKDRGGNSSYSNSRDKRGGYQDKRNFNDKGKRNQRKNEKPAPQFFPVRIYVGLGEDHGLKPHEVKDFIAKHATVDREEIGFATVRTSYSFVDVTKDAAEKALSKDSGYEFEGKLITVERALTANPPKRKNPREYPSEEASE